MVLGPERNQRDGDRGANGGEPVNPGLADDATGDQEARIIESRTAVMGNQPARLTASVADAAGPV